MAGLTLREAAERLGLSHNAIAGYEQNLYTPALDTLGRLADLYAVLAGWLLDGGTTPEAAGVLGRLETWLGGLPALARERVTLVLRMSPPREGAAPSVAAAAGDPLPAAPA
jgi:transcriptional regulator with XRE-family HTH domain